MSRQEQCLVNKDGWPERRRRIMTVSTRLRLTMLTTAFTDRMCGVFNFGFSSLFSRGGVRRVAARDIQGLLTSTARSYSPKIPP